MTRRELMSGIGLLAAADRTVPRILNRDQSASCPLEARVEKLEDPAQMVEALRAFRPAGK